MAANSQIGKLVSFGKQVLGQTSFRSSASLLPRRSMHVSVYDKNREDHVQPATVPDEVIEVKSEEYWSPHPQSGVFGPATDHKETVVPASPESVLDQKTFFRPLEDLDKPPHP